MKFNTTLSFEIKPFSTIVPFKTSKFGTIVLEEKKGKEISTPQDGSDSETDDATDDEGLVGVSQQSALSSKYIERKVSKDDHYILQSLSFPLHQDDVREWTNEASPVKIRCGNVCIQLSRIRLQLCFSRIQPVQKKKIIPLLPGIGASITSEFSLNTTHLVTPDLISTAKTICAWTCNIPIVTMSYINALVSRKQASDHFPDPEDYAASGLSQLNLNILKMPGAARGMLNGYTCLSLQRTEAEVMLRCGGAEIIPLYQEKGKKMDFTFWQNKQWWEDLEKRVLKDDLTIVWLDSTSRKTLKGKQYLSKIMQRQEDENSKTTWLLKCVNQTSIANALTSLSVLKDVHGEDILKAASKGNPTNNQSPTYPSSPKSISTSKNSALDVKSMQEFKNESMDHPIGDKGDETRKNRVTSKGKETNKIHSTEEIAADGYGKVDSSTRGKTKTTNGAKNGTDWMCTINNHKSREKESTDIIDDPLDQPCETLQKDIETEKKEKEPKVTKKKTKSLLSSTNDGWLVAAPVGDARKELRKRWEEASSFDEDMPSCAASTDICNNLIVRDQTKSHSDTERSNVSPDHQSKTDFKKFKKNVVISGLNSSKVHLTSVLPKESEKQRQLRELVKKEDEEKVIDNELMEDTGPKPSKKRKSNSITQFFGAAKSSAANAERGSVRRRVGRRALG